VRLSGWLGHEAAAIVDAAIAPLCGPAGKQDDRRATQRRADALTDVCRLALGAGELPENGGDRAQLILTIRHDDLLHRIGHGTLDTGLVDGMPEFLPPSYMDPLRRPLRNHHHRQP
jgi:hypothetical protein